MSNSDLFYLSSGETLVNSQNKVKQQMPVKEQFNYAMYTQIEEQLFFYEVDFLKMKNCFKEIKIFQQIYSQVNKKDILSQIQESFDNGKNVLLIYSGSSDTEGNWILNGEEKLMFLDVINLLKNKKQNNMCHLLLIADCNYAGSWVLQLQKQNCPNFSIQASCTKQQKSVCDRKIGSYFLHNLQKILLQKKTELIIEPLLNKQTPIFYGNFFKVYTCFNLQLNFQSWSDMRKALGISQYGNWPYFDMSKIQQNDQEVQDKIYIDDYHYAKGDFDENGIINGYVLIYNSKDFLIYDGQMKDNKKHGEGILYSTDQAGKKIYEGNFVNDKKQGFGILYYLNGQKKYEGNFFQDKYNENGKCYNERGELVFEGIFFMGKKKGKGKLYNNGILYQEGIWNNDILQGQVKQYHANGNLQFEGQFQNGKPHGKCKEYHQNGNLKFDGVFFEGNYHDQCKLYAKNEQLICEGFFLKGKIHGEGVIFQEDGQKLFEGQFINGKMNPTEGKLFSNEGSEKISLSRQVTLNFNKITDAPDIKKYLKKQLKLEEYFKRSLNKNNLTKRKRNISSYQTSQNDSVFTINTVKKENDNVFFQKGTPVKSKSVMSQRKNSTQSERIRNMSKIDKEFQQLYKQNLNNKNNFLQKNINLIQEESVVLSEQQLQNNLKIKNSKIFDFNQIQKLQFIKIFQILLHQKMHFLSILFKSNQFYRTWVFFNKELFFFKLIQIFHQCIQKHKCRFLYIQGTQSIQ